MIVWQRLASFDRSTNPNLGYLSAAIPSQQHRSDIQKSPTRDALPLRKKRRFSATSPPPIYKNVLRATRFLNGSR